MCFCLKCSIYTGILANRTMHFWAGQRNSLLQHFQAVCFPVHILPASFSGVVADTACAGIASAGRNSVLLGVFSKALSGMADSFLPCHSFNDYLFKYACISFVWYLFGITRTLRLSSDRIPYLSDKRSVVYRSCFSEIILSINDAAYYQQTGGGFYNLWKNHNH